MVVALSRRRAYSAVLEASMGNCQIEEALQLGVDILQCYRIDEGTWAFAGGGLLLGSAFLVGKAM